MLTLTQTLLLEEAAPRQAIGRALFASVTQELSFLRALLDTGALPEAVLARYLARSRTPASHHVVPMLELATRLPQGLCARLLAIPVRRDPATGTVDVIVANGDDPHPAREIAFHLRATVRTVRAPLEAIERALDELEAHGMSRSAGPGARAPTTAWASSPPPRRSVAVPGLPEGLASVRPPANTPPWGTPIHQAMVLRQRSDAPSPWSAPPPSTAPPAAVRAIAGGTQRPPPMRAQTETAMGEGYAFDLGSLRPVVELRNGEARRPSNARILEMLRVARARDEVLELLIAGAHEVASRVALFVVKREGFVGWTCTPEFADPAALRSVLVPFDATSAFDRSVREGLYLGPIAHTETTVSLLLVMRRATRDVTITAVRVGGKPVVVIVADELGDTMLATARLEELATVAGQALTRILRTLHTDKG